MRALLAPAILAASLAFAAPALAKSSSKFASTVEAPLNQAVKIEVVLSESMAYRADHLPKKLSDRSGGRASLNSGFSNNGYYGDTELDRLTQAFEKRIAHRFNKEGIRIDDTASTILRVTIEDAKPNRPTFGQLSKEPSLSYKSFGVGGAEVSGELISAGGQSLGTMTYAWYENDIRDAAYSIGTWSDANRTFRRFAKKAANSLVN